MFRIFGHYIATAYFFLGVAEFLVCGLSLLAGAYVRIDGADPARVNDNVWITALLYASLMQASLVAVGLYQRGLPYSAGLLVRLGLAFLFTSMAMSLCFYALPELFLGRDVMVLTLLFSVVGILGLRSAFYRLSDIETRGHRILVLGTGDQAQMVHEIEDPTLGFTVAGYVQLSEHEDKIPEARRVRLKVPLLSYAVQEQIDELVIAPDDRRRRLPIDEILDCKMSGIRVLDLLSFFEKEVSRINTKILHPSWIFFSSGFEIGGVGRYGKRLLDIVGAILILLIGSPLLLATTLAIMIESGSRAPVLYHQRRVGLDGREFWVHKFRSMRTDAEADGTAKWAEKDDPRITRVGSFIRRMRLDEMPQAWNVLKGEMSLVGPRPERPEFVEQLTEKIPYYGERHRVKPGLTGWAQLCYEYGSSNEDARLKLEYDLYYVKNASIFLDLIILLETVEVVLWGKGAR